jgi:predicted GIY-YIG superfamily endonuclease
MCYTYVLETLAGPTGHYIGHTEDLRQRLGDHNRGRCPHTARHAPWKVKFYAAFETMELACRFERYLKSGSGHAFAHRHLGW